MMHIFSMKAKTKQQHIAEIRDAEILYLPLSQNIGRASIPMVQQGDIVLQYQLIAKADGILSSNLHAPVSGEVVGIRLHPLVDGTLTETIVLKNDFKYKQTELAVSNLETITSDQIIDIIEKAGIVGEGGAQFPTHVKYTLNDSKINTFIINGTECEPYLTADYILMRDETEALFKSIVLINKVLNAQEVVITIEEQNKELINIFSKYTSKDIYQNIRIVVLPNQYPQGGELQLIKSITGKEILKGTFPRNVGVIVSNIGTISAVYKAAFEGKPVIDRIVTVSGEKATKYGNFRLKIGTPIGHIIQELGLKYDQQQVQLVQGGPMMGIDIVETSAPIRKGSSSLLLLTKKKEKKNNCIQCGYCADVCPMHLMPMKFADSYARGKFAKMESDNIMQCIECAACEYICPSSVPLIESIKKGKSALVNSLNYAK